MYSSNDLEITPTFLHFQQASHTGRVVEQHISQASEGSDQQIPSPSRVRNHQLTYQKPAIAWSRKKTTLSLALPLENLPSSFTWQEPPSYQLFISHHIVSLIPAYPGELGTPRSQTLYTGTCIHGSKIFGNNSLCSKHRIICTPGW